MIMGEPRELIGTEKIETSLARPEPDALVQHGGSPLDLKAGIIIELPETIPGLDEGDSSRLGVERANQRRLHAIRQFILQQEGGADFAWLPQAMEAFLRSQRSDFLPAVGRARGIQILPETGVVRLLTLNHEGTVAPFDLRIDELRPYSLELAVTTAERGRELPAINYTDEMATAVAGLPPEPALSWDHITRAARSGDPELLVKIVGSDMMFGTAEGVGVFVHNDRPESGRWSLAKVTHDQVPTTIYERRLLEQANFLRNPQHADPQLEKFWLLVYDAFSAMKRAPEHEFGYHDRKFTDEIRLAWKKLRGNDPDYLFVEQLRTLMIEDMHADRSVADDVRKYILENKGKFKAAVPFETQNLPADLENSFRATVIATADRYAKIAALLNEAKATLLPLLEAKVPPQPQEGDRIQEVGYRRYADVVDTLKELEPAALTTHVKGLLE